MFLVQTTLLAVAFQDSHLNLVATNEPSPATTDYTNDSIECG